MKFTNKRVYLLLGAVVLLAFISMYAVYSTEGFSGREGFTDSSGGAEFYLIYADWCPHCKEVFPKIEQMGKDYTEINGRPITIKAIESNSGNPLIKELPKVKGYPTFYFRKDGFTEEYKGGRDEDSILAFIKSKLT